MGISVAQDVKDCPRMDSMNQSYSIGNLFWRSNSPAFKWIEIEAIIWGAEMYWRLDWKGFWETQR
jgi:hypothetical protein